MATACRTAADLRDNWLVGPVTARLVRRLDTVPAAADPAVVSESPYALPLEEFVARFRVPVSEHVIGQAVPEELTDLDRSAGDLPMGDGGAAAGCD